MDIQIKTIPVTPNEAIASPEIATSTPAAEVTVVELIGEVNYNTAPAVEAAVFPLAQPNVLLLLNMTQVSYMSSAGLRMLLSLYRHVTAQDGKIVLVGLIEEIRDAMSVTGFLDFFTDCDRPEAAFSALGVVPVGQPAS
jgi:anti-sigma B factor antagonist